MTTNESILKTYALSSPEMLFILRLGKMILKSMKSYLTIELTLILRTDYKENGGKNMQSLNGNYLLMMLTLENIGLPNTF
jgi:hypothetical protein